MSSAFGARRFDRSPATAALALGDLAVLTGLLAAGFLRHNESIVGAPLRFADTLAPFLVGWIAASLVVGAYGSRARRSVRGAALVGGATWLVAVVVGSALRSTDLFHGDAPLAFVAVVGGLGLVAFVAWRSVFAVVSG
jgi:hypothetical protein